MTVQTQEEALPANTINDLPVVEVGADADAGTEEPKGKRYNASKLDIWMLGITIGLGGQYFSWNSGLHAGLYTFLLDVIIVGVAYVMLCCCTSEITGALPFAGGAYGLSRCTLGLYPGYLIGCAEALEYIAYVSGSVMSLAKMVVEVVPQFEGYEPLIWLGVYAHACYVHYRGDRFFWRWNFFIGSLSLLIVLMYCFGSLPHVNFAEHADTDPKYRFIDGFTGFLRYLPLACWFFVGVEALNLASDDVLDARTTIPMAQISSIMTLFFVGIFVFFVTVSLPPPGLFQVAKLLAPFDNGFQLMFDMPLVSTTLFSIPAMYATTFGFMWGYGKLIHAMALSKLFPPALARTSDKYDTPTNAVLFGTLLSYGVSLLVHFVPSVEQYLFNICITAAFLGYAGQCVGYIAIKRFYPALKESPFQSPFGIYGAIFSLAVWVLGLVSVACFQDQYGIEIVSFLVVVALLSLFYVGYSKKHQTFSRQENKVFLKAHVMMFNLRKESKRNLVSKNPGRKRHRHVVIHAEPHKLDDITASETRKGSQIANGSTTPLPLPKTKWLPNATPFHRYFSNPKLVEAEYVCDVTRRKSESQLRAIVPHRRERDTVSLPPLPMEDDAPFEPTRRVIAYATFEAPTAAADSSRELSRVATPVLPMEPSEE